MERRDGHGEDGLLGELRLLNLVEEIGGPRALDIHEAHDAAVGARHRLGKLEEAL